MDLDECLGLLPATPCNSRCHLASHHPCCLCLVIAKPDWETLFCALMLSKTKIAWGAEQSHRLLGVAGE